MNKTTIITSIIFLLFINLGILTATSIKQKKLIPVKVICEPQRDIGFYVAAHLNLPDVAICVYNKQFIKEMDHAKKEMGISDERLKKEAPALSKELNKYWRVHRLVRVPIYFDNFNDTETAYKLLLGKIKVNKNNDKIYQVLKKNILVLYPYMDKYSPAEKTVAEKLVNLIEYEYYNFYKQYGEKNKALWQKESLNFKNTWNKEYAPAITALNSKSQEIKEIQIILSPALQRHGKSFRVINGIGRVATLLPKDNEELQRGLQNAYHEMCHGISDKIVYKEMNLNKNNMSFKNGEKGKEIHNTIENAADQAMYIGLKAVNSKMLYYFFHDGMYGDLSWLLKSNFESTLNFIGRVLSKKEISKLKSEMKSNPIKASEYIYKNGLLINKKVLIKLNVNVESTK